MRSGCISSRLAQLLSICLAWAGVECAEAQIVDPNLWVTDGTVNAVARSGNLIFIGGAFQSVGPATGSGVPINSSTGLASPLTPKVVGTVIDVAADGAGGWFIGGSFTSVGGVPRSNAAHIASDFSVGPWNPGPNGPVLALTLDGTTVYAAGGFTTIGGQPRSRIAALDATTGLATGWNPGANDTVRTMVLSGSRVLAGGDFTVIGGQVRSRVAALDVTIGLPTAWSPNANGSVRHLAVAGTKVYAGGVFTIIGGQPRTRVAQLSASTGAATTWNVYVNGAVNAVAVGGPNLYVGGEFDTVGTFRRSRIASLDTTLGMTRSSWNPNATGGRVTSLAAVGPTVFAGGAFTAIGGQPRNRIAELDALTTGAATAWNPNVNGEVRTLSADGPLVYAGGAFTSVGGLPRNNIAALNATTGAATTFNPNCAGIVHALAVLSPTVYVGGDFGMIGGQLRNDLAAVDTGGVVTPWNPGVSGDGFPSEVRALAIHGSRVYVGGTFSFIGGLPRFHIAALNRAPPGTALASWNPNAGGTVRALAVRDTNVYAGGFFTTIGGVSRNFIAALDTVTGAARAWNPNANGAVHAIAVSPSLVYAAGAFTQIGFMSRHFIAPLDRNFGSSMAWPDADAAVNALALGPVVHAGGLFTQMGPQNRGRLAALAPESGAVAGWNPNADGDVRALAVFGFTVYAGGAFRSIGGQPQSGIAALHAPLVVFGVRPMAGGNAGPVRLTVGGSGILPGATARLVRVGQPDRVGSQIEVSASGTILNASFNLAGAAIGGWYVVVTNPDLQTGVAPDSFVVQSLKSPQLRVDLLGPSLIRSQRLTTYDVVVQNFGNVDARTTPLWITGIPAGATVQTRPPVAPAPRTGTEPDWSLVPETFASPNGTYLVDVIPHVAPGIVTRRVSISVPDGTLPFVLGAAVTPPWIERPAFESCMSAVVATPSCMSAVLEQVNDSLDARPDIKAMSGVGVWAKVGWHCEGAATLPAALVQAEQALDFMVAAVENGTAGGPCRDMLLPLWRDTLAVNVVFSIDPNDKLGPDGPVSESQAIPYTIRFENMEDAPGDAQYVMVVDPLDLTMLNATSVELQAIRFGNQEFTPTPANPTFWELRRLAPNLEVEVNARVEYGVVTWEFKSLDPENPGFPPDVVGFLPPNDTPPQGEGSILFTVKLLASVTDSTEVQNHALITMDNQTVTTPETTTLIGQGQLSSEVQDFAPAPDSTRFTVRWSALSEGIRDYTIYVRKDGGDYWTWRTNTTATADTFHSQPGGHEYAFYSEAKDEAGNVEPEPLGPDAIKISRTTGNEEVPTWRLALEGARPNPAIGRMRVWFTLPDQKRATLELIDVAGRRVTRREVGELGPGRHSVELGSPRLRPGLYFIRLAQGGEPALIARVAFMR